MPAISALKFRDLRLYFARSPGKRAIPRVAPCQPNLASSALDVGITRVRTDFIHPMNRRSFLTSTAAMGALAPLSRAFAEWQPSPRYPDPLIKVIDPSFAPYRLSLAKVERIATGLRWAEGPVWYLLWSDIPNNRIMRWDEETGAVSVFRKPSNNSNGNTRDRQGRLLSCEHDARRVTRTEYDGSITLIADRFEGKQLNSPNDLVCKSDGSIWFTDPPFGILGNYEGHVASSELPTNVYRWDPTSKQLAVVAGDVNRPNGLAFSPDESKLYIVEAGVNPRVIRAYDVEGGRRLSNPRPFITAQPNGTPDGLRVDVDGNLWCGWGMGAEGLDGVAVFNATGKLIGRIDLPERCANVCFGGVKRNRLFMCGSTSMFSLFVNTQGVAGG
jgi:gluconolactonase